MKHYCDYKKLFSYILLVLFIFLPVVFLSAETVQELNKKISTTNSDILKLEKEIAQYQVELNSLGKQKSSLDTSIKQLDLTRKKLETDIALTQKKIEKTNFKIQELSSEIGVKGNQILNNIDAIKLGIRNINEIDQENFIATILSDESFTSTWTDVENTISVREKMREKVKELQEVKVDLEDTRAETVAAKEQLAKLKNSLADQKKIVDQNTLEKKKLLTLTKNSEATYQKLLAEKLAKKEAFEKELEDYESQLKFILNPKLLPTTRVLSWPLGYVYVTSPYGARWGRIHRGTDFRASVGTPVKSMADGIVKGVGDTDLCCPGASFGKWIFIEYNNGLSSTYGHLSLIKVVKGQKVSRGQIVGYSGNTGSSTGPHLHVSVYASSGVEVGSFESKSYPGRILVQPISATDAHIDPMKYLPLYKN